jgi:hypothetical protein
MTEAKRAGGVAQVVECPPDKCKALSSNLNVMQKFNLIIKYRKPNLNVITLN